MKQARQFEEPVRLVTRRDVISGVLSGAAAGLITWVLTYFLSHYVIGPIACTMGTSLIACDDATEVSASFALVLASVVALTILVRQRVFRPLLVVLAALATLWGLGGTWLAGSELADIFLTLLVAAVVYAAFTWLAYVRQFWVAAIITLVVVIIFRLLINA